MDLVLSVRRLPTDVAGAPPAIDLRVRGELVTAGELAACAATLFGMPRAHLHVSGIAVGESELVGRWPLVHGASVVAHPEVALAQARVPVRPSTPFDVVATAGPDCGRRITLSRSGITVGRGDVDLSLHDDTLSRRHARISVESGHLKLVDLGSTNGSTISNDPGTDSTGITVDDRIKLGHSVIELRPRIAAGPPPAPVEVANGRRLLPVGACPPDPPPVVTVTQPRPPEPVSAAAFPWITMLVPLPIAAVLAVAFGPQFLLFALLGPVTSGASWWQDRRRRHREEIARTELFGAEQHRAMQAIVEATDREVTALNHLAMDTDRVLQSVHACRPPWWATDPGGESCAGVTNVNWPRGLPVRLGLGSPASRTVRITGADGQATSPTLADAPVVIDLQTVGGLRFFGDRSRAHAALRQVVGGLVSRHPPSQLALVVDLGATGESEAAWLRWLPHTAWIGPDSDAAARTVESGRVVLSITFANDVRAQTGPGGPAVTLRRVGNQGSFADLLLGSDDDVLRHPDGDTSLVTDGVGPWWAERLARAMAGQTPLLASTATHEHAPWAHLRCEVLAIRSLEPASVKALLTQWEHFGPRTGPRAAAVVGQSGDGPWTIDLDTDGPHLLIAGTTGSGKSEALRSLVSGLALRLPPESLTFLLIDYKGGSTFTLARRLPHCVGVVSDLDPALAERALRSLRAEVKRRESALEATGSDTIHAHNAATSHDPFPRLVVVVDEFRVLAQEIPSFLDGLVRLAAVGRSLGIHLVLATQRPAGAITPDIQANIGTRIALRVRDDQESVQVIGDSRASQVPRSSPGAGFTRSADGDLAPVRAFHITRILPTPVEEPTRFDPVPPDDLPSPLPTESAGPSESDETVEDALVALVEAAHARRGIGLPRTPWLPPLRALISIDDLESPVPDTWPVGLVDLPDEQLQLGLTWAPDDPPWRIIGGPRSGRSTALATIATAASLALGDRLHVYAVSASPAVSPLDALSTVGAVIMPDQIGRLRRLVELVRGFEGDSAPDDHLLLLIDDVALGAGPDTPAAGALKDLVRMATDPSTGRVSLVLAGARSLATTRLVDGGPTICLPGLDSGDLLLLGIRPSVAQTLTGPGRGLRVEDGALVQFAVADGCRAIPRRRRRRVRAVEDLPSRVDLAALLTVDASGPGRPSSRQSWEVRLGVGDPSVEILSWDPMRDGRVLVVTGPAGSGRTSTVQVVERQAACAGRRILHLPDDLHAAAALDLERGSWLVSIDDVEGLGVDGEAALVKCLQAGADVVVVVSALRHTVASAYRGALPGLLARGCAVLLQPASPHDGDPFGSRIEPAATLTPGRGVFLRRGRTSEIQIALPSADEAAEPTPAA